MREGVERAAQAIDSGASARTLESLAAFGGFIRSRSVSDDFLEQMATSSRERVKVARAQQSQAEVLGACARHAGAAGAERRMPADSISSPK